jgi:ABC-type nickel/cobalt efflux system permease component RcnA
VCGDLEPEDRLETDLFQRFMVQSHAALNTPVSADEMNAYLDGLFKRVLRLCLDEADQATAGTAYRQMAMQSLVLARLAGFLAGHVALNEDPMRKVLEATMLGYQEAETKRASADHGHGHDHHGHDHGHHGHDHAHDHGHGHEGH